MLTSDKESFWVDTNASTTEILKTKFWSDERFHASSTLNHMYGVFIFDRANDILLYYYIDRNLSENLQNYANCRPSTSSEELKGERYSLEFLFLPILTVYKLYECLESQSLLEIRYSNFSCKFFPSVDSQLIILIFPSNQNSIQDRKKIKFIQKCLNFVFGSLKCLISSRNVEETRFISAEQLLIFEYLVALTQRRDYRSGTTPFSISAQVVISKSTNYEPFLNDISKFLSRYQSTSVVILVENDQYVGARCSSKEVDNGIIFSTYDLSLILKLISFNQTLNASDAVFSTKNFVIMLSDNKNVPQPWYMICWKFSSICELYLIILLPIGFSKIIRLMDKMKSFNILNSGEKISKSILKAKFKCYQKLLEIYRSYIDDSCRKEIDLYLKEFRHNFDNEFRYLDESHHKIERRIQRLETLLWTLIADTRRFFNIEFHEKYLPSIAGMDNFKIFVCESVLSINKLKLEHSLEPSNYLLDAGEFHFSFNGLTVTKINDRVITNIFPIFSEKIQIQHDNAHIIIYEKSVASDHIIEIYVVFESFVNIDIVVRQAEQLKNILCQKLVEKCLM
uniref:Uncharacterized protein n=1 Tax=Romanomermis culicivorax TaxID=13658 RepID=A0A915K861_ROMCU